MSWPEPKLLKQCVKGLAPITGDEHKNYHLMQVISGTLKREQLMGPAAGKTINDFQDDW